MPDRKTRRRASTPRARSTAPRKSGPASRPRRDPRSHSSLVVDGLKQTASRAMLPKEVQHILTIAPNGRSPAQEAAVLRAYRRFDEVRHVVGGMGIPLNFLAAAHLHGLSTRLMLEKRIDALAARVPEVPTTLVLRERKTPRPTHVMLGGDFLRKGAAVTPGVFAVLPPLETKKPTRLDLARWLTDPSHPLTARAEVNRLEGRLRRLEGAVVQLRPWYTGAAEWLRAAWHGRASAGGPVEVDLAEGNGVCGRSLVPPEENPSSQ